MQLKDDYTDTVAGLTYRVLYNYWPAVTTGLEFEWEPAELNIVGVYSKSTFGDGNIKKALGPYKIQGMEREMLRDFKS